MKFIIQFLLIVLITYLILLFLPWWGLFFTSGLVGLLVPNKGLATFFAGFLGLALLWSVQALLIDLSNESILSNRISELFSLNSAFLLILVTAVIGGVAGGFAALTGKFLRELFKKKKDTYSVYT